MGDNERQPLLEESLVSTNNLQRRYHAAVPDWRNRLEIRRSNGELTDVQSSVPADQLTTNVETMIHLLKANIGTGMMAMPWAFKNAGLYEGLVATLMMGFICTHCMHIMLKCARSICGRISVRSLDYADVTYFAFSTGPYRLRSFADRTSMISNVFICITQFGFCSVYFMFVAKNLRGVIDNWFGLDLHYRYILIAMLLPMILLNQITSLKILTPVSGIASVLTAVGLVAIASFLFADLSNTNTVDWFGSLVNFPLFFGTATFAFEGICVVLPLENKMRNPRDLGGWTGVLTTTMVTVTCLYCAVGFFGYLQYGDQVQGSITLNLPNKDILANCIRLVFGLSIFLSYTLQFYVPINILSPWVDLYFEDSCCRIPTRILFRTWLIICTFLIAMFVPCLESIISLVGACSSSALAVIFPPILEIVTFWPTGLGLYKWIMWKDICIIIFGVAGFIFGTYTSVIELFNHWDDS